MFPIFSRALGSLVAAMLVTASLSGQTHPPAPAPAPAAVVEPLFITHKDFRSKLFVVKYRKARDLKKSLDSLLSGFKGAELTANTDAGTLAVRDFPENIAAIEDALKRLDLPESTQSEVEFHFHVLFASNTGGPEGGYPEELREVLAALKATLSYRSYTQAASMVQRGQEGNRGMLGAGATEIQTTGAKGEKHTLALPFKIMINAIKVETPASGPAIIRVEGLDFAFNNVPQEWAARIRTELSLKDGEKVVVGTTTLKDRGVVLVVTAHVLK